MNDRSTVLNAFRPNAEIDDPASFAGRRFEVEELVDALLTDGACPIIYGDRGLGKTSLALQGERIALGDVQLLQNYNIEDRALPEEQRFVTVYMSCTETMRTSKAIFQALINQAEGYTSLRDVDASDKPEKRESTRTLKLKFFETKTKKTFSRSAPVSYAELGADEKLLAILGDIHESHSSPVLLIIDELDRVRDTGGLASFIKNHCGGWLRIILVGIAQNLSTLLSEHQSIERKIAPIRVKRMPKQELVSIIKNSEETLGDTEVQVGFDGSAVSKIVESSRGFPWFVHLLGQESLLRTWENGEVVVTENRVVNAIDNLSKNRFAQQFSDLYNASVKDSYHREIVLRLLAKWWDDDVPISEIYKSAKIAGVSNPSQYKKHLTQERYGRSIVDASHDSSGIVRFRNAMFKRYVDLRHSTFSGVKEGVDQIWEARGEA